MRKSDKHLLWKEWKKKKFVKIVVVFVNPPWMLLPNFKQIQWNLTVHHELFLHQLTMRS